MSELVLKRLKISITNACNLGCAHCYLNPSTYVFIDFDFLKKILDDAKKIGVEIIDLTGGEPTTHPNFKDIVLYAYNLGFKINLSTNGINLKNEEFYKLVSDTKIECHISLDATSEETLSKIRGEGVYSELQRTLQKLRENSISYTLRFSLNKLNYKDVPSIIDYAISTNTDIAFGATQLAGRADHSLILNNNEFEWIKSVIQNKKEHCNIYIEECFTTPFPCDGACMDILSINHYGQPVSCLMVEADKQEESNTCISPILNSMFKKAYDEKKRLKQFSMSPKCNNCQYHYLCQSGCLVTAHTMGCV